MFRKHIAGGETDSSFLSITETGYSADFARKLSTYSKNAQAQILTLENNYGAFAQAVRELRAQLQTLGKSRLEHPDLIGEGCTSEVYKINVEGKQYACRFFGIKLAEDCINEYWETPEEFWSRTIREHPHNFFEYDLAFKLDVIALALMSNTPGFIQPYAISYSEQVSITNILPGQPVKAAWEAITSDEARYFNIPDTHINALFDSLELAYKKDMDLDLVSDNLLYDRQAGFSIVDYNVVRASDTNCFSDLLTDAALHIVSYGHIPCSLLPCFIDFMERYRDIAVYRYGNGFENEFNNIFRYIQPR